MWSWAHIGPEWQWLAGPVGGEGKHEAGILLKRRHAAGGTDGCHESLRRSRSSVTLQLSRRNGDAVRRGAEAILISRRPVLAPWVGCPACPFQGSCACDPADTGHQHNTHIIEIREVCYPWHPWYVRKVGIHATMVRRDVAVAHCCSGDVQTGSPFGIAALDVGFGSLSQDPGGQGRHGKRRITARVEDPA